MLPALVAVGGSLAAGQACALELGELQVQSKLGQPLRASIAFALGPNEKVNASCVAIRSSGSGLPDASGTTISVANGVISLTGRTPVREPLMTANIVVDCPYTPHVSREMMLFLDPADVPAVASAPAPRVAQVRPAATSQSRRQATAQQETPAATPVGQASRYRVVPGDSLSAIAGRLQNREIGLQAAMTAIFDANPDAFINNDPNLLQAGSWLDIPSLAGGEVVTQTVATTTIAPDTTTQDTTALNEYTDIDTTVDATVYNGAVSQAPADEPEVTTNVAEPTVSEIVDAPPEPVPAPVASEPAAESQSAYADLQPGDVVVDGSLVADSAADAAIIPDTTVASPPTAAERQVRGTQIIGAPAKAESSWNWLIWLAVGIISVFGGYLMFGQRLLERFGSRAVNQGARTRPQSAQGTPRVAPITVPESEMAVEEIKPVYDDVDFDLSDDSPTEENLALDADLISGSGLEESNDMDVNQDFGFAATTDLDLELTERDAQTNESPETDIIPPPDRTSQEMIIDSEVLPDDSQYEMSVIVDATKMPDPDDVTERDLKAVPVEDNGQTLISDAYTINEEAALETLEQDYEDEYTATQALSKEIEKAAAELAETMESASDPDGDTSVQMQLTDISDLDVTSQLEAQNDDIGADDITAQIEADDKTVEMPGKDRTKAS
jgi:FimV-like protein